MKTAPSSHSRIRPVPQEHPMGCAVACVAAQGKVGYQEAFVFFENRAHAWTRGFYCEEVVAALAEMGMTYSYASYRPVNHRQTVQKPGTIVFVAPSPRYPAGHYLLRAGEEWMNPWSNFPLMNPVRAAMEKSLPGRISYVIFSRDGKSAFPARPISPHVDCQR